MFAGMFILYLDSKYEASEMVHNTLQKACSLVKQAYEIGIDRVQAGGNKS